MRLHDNTRGRPGRLVPAMTTAAILAVTLAACSSPGSTATQVTGKQRSPAAPTAAAPAASSPAPAAAAAASGLTGKWAGRYGGSYQGTFKLHWHQSGSKLKGFIQLSNPGINVPINGSVAGSSIRFGTVGSYGITYSGTVSGKSMSGTYQVSNGAAGTGHWSAAKS